MAATPRKRGLKPRGNSVFLSDVLGGTIKAYRAFLNLSQQDLADRITELQKHGTADEATPAEKKKEAPKPKRWHSQTVSEVEKGARVVTVEELFALALALETSTVNLLLPVAYEETPPSHYDVGGPEPLDSLHVRQLLMPTGGDKSPYLRVMVWKGNTPIAVTKAQTSFHELKDILDTQEMPWKTQQAMAEAAEREGGSTP